MFQDEGEPLGPPKMRNAPSFLTEPLPSFSITLPQFPLLFYFIFLFFLWSPLLTLGGNFCRIIVCFCQGCSVLCLCHFAETKSFIGCVTVKYCSYGLVWHACLYHTSFTSRYYNCLMVKSYNNSTKRMIFKVNTDISAPLSVCRYFGEMLITTLPQPTHSLPLSRLSMWGSTRKSVEDTAPCAWSS